MVTNGHQCSRTQSDSLQDNAVSHESENRKLPNSTEFPFAEIDETKHGKDRRVIQVVHTRVSKKSKLFTYRL